MARTAFLRALRALAAERRIAARTGRSLNQLRDERAAARVVAAARGVAPDMPRRRFLGNAAAVAAGAILPWRLAACSSDDPEQGNPEQGYPRIAIIGGGIAGLSTALTLRDGGYAATVYEVSKTRVGGRMRTERPAETTGCGICHAASAGAPEMQWADGQVTDIYGELIDTSHETIIALAERYGLGLTNAIAAEPAGSTETYYFDGAHYPKATADADFAAIFDAVTADADAAGYPTTWESSTAEGRELDSMSIYDWIESRVPGGHTSPLGKLLDIAYAIEYGADTTDQSALNLLYLLSSSEADRLLVFGESDEALRITGGADQLPRAIADDLGLDSTVKLGWDFLAIRKLSDGTYSLSFDAPAGSVEVLADYVVLALPFAKLRTLEHQDAGFDELKLKAIDELGRGKNGKLHLQFSSRLWNEQGVWGLSGGTAYSDTGFQLAWDPTRGQAGTSGILACYTGGSAVDQFRLDHAYGNAGSSLVLEDAQLTLGQLEPVFPGLTALWNGNVNETLAHKDPRLNASYCYWRVGQAQTIGGYERVRQGNVFFAGEHTSLDWQGFMEGAASEGVATAQEILAELPKRA